MKVACGTLSPSLSGVIHSGLRSCCGFSAIVNLKLVLLDIKKIAMTSDDANCMNDNVFEIILAASHMTGISALATYGTISFERDLNKRSCRADP